MTGSELAAALRTLATLVESQKRVAGLKVEPAPGVVVSVRSSGAVRQARHRGNKASRSNADGDVSRVEVRPPKRHAERNESVTQPVTLPVTNRVTSAVTEPVTAPLGFPLASPSGSPSDLPKEIAVVSEGPVRSPARKTPEATTAARPRNHAEAAAEPAAYVAELCRPSGTYDVTYAGLIQVHRMPWVLKPIQAWHEAGGDERELRLEAADGEVRAMVELTARGYLTSDLVRVARYLRGTEKYREKVLASSMTKAVVDIALAELNEKPQRSSFAADLIRRVDAGASRPAPLGDLLPKVAGGGQ